jgi:hypothetical protein
LRAAENKEEKSTNYKVPRYVISFIPLFLLFFFEGQTILFPKRFPGFQGKGFTLA